MFETLFTVAKINKLSYQFCPKNILL